MLTVKVNGTVFGLVHKGSMHMAKNTVPDVCKTPSPAGPVPIPYPVIISMASDLANGTTTVKADGGNMIAVKDCEYAMCAGDEAGTAGGVVSSTFKKEAKFITFSFDVKMDGKNACRLGDKMTMNHQNTVCMAGTFPSNCKPNEYPLKIDCADKKKNSDWDDCMVKELCAKVKKFNAKKKKKKRLTPSPSNAPPGSKARKAYDGSLGKFEKSFAAKVANHKKNPDAVKNMFMHECRYEEWKKNQTADPARSGDDGMNPDHVHDAALDGSMGLRNMKWINNRVNTTIGAAVGHPTGGFDDKKHTKIKPHPSCGCK
jgi:hypothetical protein